MAPLVLAFVVILLLGLAVGLAGVGRHASGPLHRLDTWIYAMVPINRHHTTGPSMLIGHVFTVDVLGPITVALALGLWLAGERFRSLVPVIAFVGAELLVLILKVSTYAPPPRAPEVLHPLRLAFPSGHATAAGAVAISLAPFAVERVRAHWPWAIALAAGFVVCISRMTLAVHWFSDVSVGWGLGTLWGLAVTQVAREWARAEPQASTTLGHRG